MSIHHFDIPFDTTTLPLEVPQENLEFCFGLEEKQPHKDNKFLLKQALNADNQQLARFVDGKRIGLIIEDATRDVPQTDLMTVSGPYLKSAAKIDVFLATGTHDGQAEGNQQIVTIVKKTAEKYRLPLNRIIIHDCHQDEMVSVGVTAGIGNEIQVNKASLNAEAFVIFSDMKNHYFAGYSNPLKNFMPGICAYKTTERNHALALKAESTFGTHPLHPDPTRRTNPLAQDMLEAWQLISRGRKTFVLATISQRQNILWAGAGLLNEICSTGISKVDELMSETVDTVDCLIVSCGGYPNDESLYAAQRALELTKYGVREGGEILFIAGCANGIGPQKSIANFFNPMQDEIRTTLNHLQKKYVMYSHKTYKFAQLIEKTDRIHVISKLSHQLVRSIHLHPVAEAQKVIDRWLRQSANVKIGIVADGNKMALQTRQT